MKSQYDNVVRSICGDNWESDQVSPDEKDGGYGVAICLACLKGCPAKLNDLSDYIGTPPFLLEIAYKRLQINGIFSLNSPILDDTELLFSRAETEEDMERCLKAWCHIAGLSSGFVGKASLRQDMIRKQPVKTNA